MPSNVKDVPSTDSEVKLSSYGTSPPIPHTNRTYLGPHDITKKKDFLRQLQCVCLCILYDRCVVRNVRLRDTYAVHTYEICVLLCMCQCFCACIMNICMFACMFCIHECIIVCIYVCR